ncbi:MAG: polysaccharide biosynthesis C-terminal domain-containing protein [Sphingobacteriaceae bacterium]|nr:polysaccharide biosynthesis C-terminal domain-containing protein [Sphingobacteriaceae bacterium]
MLKKVIQSLFTKGSVAVVNFLILIVTAKYLGISTRGEIGLIMLNLAIIQMINEIYTGYSLVHFIAKFNVNKIYLNGMLFTLISSIGTNLILVLLHKQPSEYAWLLFVSSIIIILNTFNCVVILAKEYYKMYNFLSIFQPVALLVGIFVFTNFYGNFTLDSYIWPLIISFALSFIISSYFVLVYILKPDTKTEFALGAILKNGLYCQAGVLMYILSGRLSYYLLETKPDVGLYSTASSLIEAVLIITNSVTPILLSRVAILGKTDNSIKLTLIFAKLCFLVSILAVVVIYFYPYKCLLFYWAIALFKVNQSCFCFRRVLSFKFLGIISHYFSGIGNIKMVSFYNFFGFAATLILAPILIAKHGIAGAAITTNIAYFITFVASIIVFLKITGVPFSSLFNLKDDIKELKSVFSGD